MKNVMKLWTAKLTISTYQIVFITSLCFLILLNSIGAANASTYNHASGNIKISSVPKKVVVFDLGALDTLDSLNVPIVGVTKTHTGGFLSAYRSKKYKSVGSLFEPDYESVASLSPDIIFIGTRTQPTYQMMNSIAPTFDASIENNDFLLEFAKATTNIASIFNKSDIASNALAEITQKQDAIREMAINSGDLLMVMTSGGKLTVFGQNSRYGWIFNELNIKSGMDSLGNSPHGEPISMEYLLKINPEHLLVLDRDAAIGRQVGTAKALLDNETFKKLSAHQNDKVVFLNSFAWYTVGNGLTAVNQMLDDLADVFTN
ncbi:MAG: siderophore ABC transporter substrate-binding protein [Pseudomonadota bacterium]